MRFFIGLSVPQGNRRVFETRSSSVGEHDHHLMDWTRHLFELHLRRYTTVLVALGGVLLITGLASLAFGCDGLAYALLSGVGGVIGAKLGIGRP